MSTAPARAASEASARRVRPTSSWSLRRRLLVAVVAVFVVLTSGIAVASIVAMRGVLIDQVDGQIHASQESVVGSVNLSRGFVVDGDQQPQDGASPLSVVSYVLIMDDHVEVAQTREGYDSSVQLSDENAASLAALAGNGCQTVSFAGGLGDQRACSYTVPLKDVNTNLPTGRVAQLVIAAPLRSTYATLFALAFIIAVSVFVAALALVALGDVLIRRALRPLTSVIATTERISQLPLDAGEVQLSNRVVIDDPATEVGRVSESVNRMLEHIESSLEARAESERKVRQFVADASHELRTPLAAVQGYAEITRKHEGALSEEARTSLTRIEAAATRMSALVNDLLLLARLDEGTEIDRGTVDLSLLVIDAVADAQAAGPDHPVVLELPEEPIEVIGDLLRLQQVVANLLANARIHTPPGTRVEARLSTEGDHAVLEIADDGPGVPPQLQATLFERFVRGDASRSRAAGSSGLGLAIVRAIMTAHGGSIALRSEPGDTVFTIRVPRAGTDAQTASTPTP